MAYRDIILADNPNTYWPLQQSGADATGKGHTLTLNANTTYYEGALPGNEESSGMWSSGGNATGGDPTGDLTRRVYSAECWLKPTNYDGNYRSFLAKGNGAMPGGRNPHLFLSPTAGLHVTQETSTPASSQVYIDAGGGGRLLIDAWNHIVFTCSGTGGRIQLFVNGVLTDVVGDGVAYSGSGSGSWPAGAVLATNTAQWYVGNISTATTVGGIDEVAYYPYVLSADQVKAHFEAGLTSGFKGYQRAVMQEKPTVYYSRAADTRYYLDETHNSATLDLGDQANPWSMVQPGPTGNGLGGLALWLDPSQQGTGPFPAMTDGQTFPDTGATAYSGVAVVPIVAGQGPIYKTGGINGKSYLQQFASPNRAVKWPVNYAAQPCTIFGVAKMRPGGAKGRIFSSIVNNWLLGWHGGFENEGYFEGWDYGANNVASGSQAATDNLRVFTARLPITASPPQPPMWKDGVLRTPIAGGTGNQGPNQICTSGYQGVSELSDADLYELIIYSRVLTDAEVNKVHGYLANKYGTYVQNGSGFFHAPAQAPGPVSSPEAGYHTYLGLTGDSGVVGDAPRLRFAGPVSVEFWIYPTTQNDGIRRTVIQKSNYDREFAINYEPDGSIQGYWGNGTANYANMRTGPGSVPLNQWTHVCLTRHTNWGNSFALGDGTGGTDIYLNGVSATTTYGTVSGGSGGAFVQAVAGTGPLTVGNGYAANPFLGRLAEIAIYQRALPVEKIRAHYALGVRGGQYPGAGGYGG